MRIEIVSSSACPRDPFPSLRCGAVLVAMCSAQLLLAGEGEMPWEARRRKIQDRMSGVPQVILDQQRLEKVNMPSIDEAVGIALAAAREVALPLTDTKFHGKGRRIGVPESLNSIQAAINAARAGDTVIVSPGTYYELLVMKDGVKLLSDPADGGDEPVKVDGARLRLPRRTLRTIIDGSRAKPSKHGMIDFDPGLGRNTIVDGFTIQNLPKQDHHVPGHAHGLNVRGASPVITNCLIRNNGSTGIGNHVVFHDQESPMPGRDFRWQNVKHRSSPVIYNNIIRGSLGLGIGANHFSEPFILGNEVFGNNDAELGEDPSPGLGNKHGSAATTIGNIVHDNPGGGILCRVGSPQGRHHIDRPTHPTVAKNVVYDNGTIRPGLSARTAGSEEMPVKFIGNYVFNAAMTGIALAEGAVGIIENNWVANSKLAGISITASTALKLNRNNVTGSRDAPNITIVNKAAVREMVGNASDSNPRPRFMLRGGTIGK